MTGDPFEASEPVSEVANSSNWMTLGDYQSSNGVPFESQIILINNERAFSGYAPVIDPYFYSKRIRKRMRGIVRRLLGTKPSNPEFLPLPGAKLFLGYFDHSFDDLSGHLAPLFQLLELHPDRHFSLLIGKGDYMVDESVAAQIPANVEFIQANNVTITHPKIKYLPMGRDFRNLPYLKDNHLQASRSILCYCNFSVDTHPVRQQIFSSLENKDFLMLEHMGQFLNYSVKRKDFLARLGASKFSICPRGNAIDTFRLWDSLYMGTIPIVVREADFHNELGDLPILFLNDESEFEDLSTEQLHETYAQFQRREFNYSKLTLEFWIDNNER